MDMNTQFQAALHTLHIETDLTRNKPLSISREQNTLHFSHRAGCRSLNHIYKSAYDDVLDSFSPNYTIDEHSTEINDYTCLPIFWMTELYQFLRTASKQGIEKELLYDLLEARSAASSKKARTLS